MGAEIVAHGQEDGECSEKKFDGIGSDIRNCSTLATRQRPRQKYLLETTATGVKPGDLDGEPGKEWSRGKEDLDNNTPYQP